MQGPGEALGSALLGVLENMQVPNTTIVTKQPVSSLAYVFPQMKAAGRSGVFTSLANQASGSSLWSPHIGSEPCIRLLRCLRSRL
ncbi:hypothetical protein ACVWY3_000535 [Bradyrhizobium sp. USDA 4486]